MTADGHEEPQLLRLRVHVSEPFDFERENESADLFGATTDGTTTDGAAGGSEWEVRLERHFTFNEREYDAVLIGPRYVGEHLDAVHEAFLGVPVRIAHRTGEGWHYAMAGMVSLAPLPQAETGTADGGAAGDDQKGE